MKYTFDNILYSSVNVKRKLIITTERGGYLITFKSALLKCD